MDAVMDFMEKTCAHCRGPDSVFGFFLTKLINMIKNSMLLSGPKMIKMF